MEREHLEREVYDFVRVSLFDVLAVQVLRY